MQISVHLHSTLINPALHLDCAAMCKQSCDSITCSMCCVAVQKEEAGDVRHEVDFEQLKIENKQYNEHYEGKNQELLRLKLSAGNTLQVLNAYKVRRRNIFRQTFMCTHTDSYVAEKASYLELGVVHAHIGDEAQERTAGED